MATKDQSYQRVDWTSRRQNGSLDANATRMFNVAGDHLTIVRVIGSYPAYVRLGDESNPWIQVHSRMVLSREFDKITFADGGFAGATPGGANTTWDAAGRRGEVRVAAFASYGPLVKEWPPREYGIKRSPLMVSGLTATTIEQEIISDLIVGPGVLDRAVSVGLNGATMLILNTGGNDLYLCCEAQTTFFPLFSGSYGFGPIVPGQSLEVKIDDLVYAFPTVQGGGLTVKTLIGTTTFSVMITSGEFNSVEPLQAAKDPQGLA